MHDLLHEDQQFLGLETAADGRSGEVLLGAPLVNPAGRLYGGAGVALAAVASEVATGRHLVWVTVQFVSPAGLGETLRYEVAESVRGQNASQVQIRASSERRDVFVALAALAEERPGRFRGVFETMPDVSPPEQGRAWNPSVPGEADSSHLDVAEVREASILEPSGAHASPRLAMWIRANGRSSATPAMLGWLADMVPLALSRVAGIDRDRGGASLDNTIRFGPVVQGTDWLLLELRPHLAARGFGHGSVLVWSRDGALLAVGSQTASMTPQRALRSQGRARAEPRA